MSSEEVIQILGQPNSSQMTDDKWVLKYSLHEKWKGNVPYYMVFNKESKQLETWYENEAEYQRNQAQMEQMLKPLLESQGGGAASGRPERSRPAEMDHGELLQLLIQCSCISLF